MLRDDQYKLAGRLAMRLSARSKSLSAAGWVKFILDSLRCGDLLAEDAEAALMTFDAKRAARQLRHRAEARRSARVAVGE